MDQYNPCEVRFHRSHTGNVIYYTYNNELYAPTFPVEWAQNHLEKTGPEYCIRCKIYGHWNGVFVGYCSACATDYNGERGNGFIFYGEEKGDNEENKENTKSAFNTYLKDVDFSEIGDIDLYDSEKTILMINSYPLHGSDEERDEEEDVCVSWSIDRHSSCSYDGGYDSY